MQSLIAAYLESQYLIAAQNATSIVTAATISYSTNYKTICTCKAVTTRWLVETDRHMTMSNHDEVPRALCQSKSAAGTCCTSIIIGVIPLQVDTV